MGRSFYSYGLISFFILNSSTIHIARLPVIRYIFGTPCIFSQRFVAELFSEYENLSKYVNIYVRIFLNSKFSFVKTGNFHILRAAYKTI